MKGTFEISPTRTLPGRDGFENLTQDNNMKKENES
jgi:hypothetical protein